jgi:hypothetical protein
LKQEHVWFRGGDLNGFRDDKALPVSGGTGPPVMVMTYIPSDVPDTRIEDMYDLGVGISMVFEILGHFLFEGDRTIQYGHALHIYLYMFLDTRNKNIYSLGVGILIVFQIFSNFPDNS